MCPWAINKTRHANQFTGCAPPKYYMQDYSYFYRFDELSLEFIGVDTTARDCPGGIGGDGQDKYFTACGGKQKACDFL